MNRIQKCLLCGNLIVGKRADALFCSSKCYHRHHYLKQRNEYIERAKTWRLDHLEYHKKVRKERYQSNPELYKAKAKEWRDANLERARETYKNCSDKRVHGGLKKVLVKQLGGKCTQCGSVSRDGTIDAHHVSGDPTDHENQTLLCRSCHMRTHSTAAKLNYKHLEMDAMLEAIRSSRTFKEAAAKLGVHEDTLRSKRKRLGIT